MQINSTFEFITQYINKIKEARQETDKFRESAEKSKEAASNSNYQTSPYYSPTARENANYSQMLDSRLGLGDYGKGNTQLNNNIESFKNQISTFKEVMDYKEAFFEELSGIDWEELSDNDTNKIKSTFEKGFQMVTGQKDRKFYGDYDQNIENEISTNAEAIEKQTGYKLGWSQDAKTGYGIPNFYNVDKELFSNKNYSKYSQSEILSNIPENAKGDLEKYSSLLKQKNDINRFFANRGIKEEDIKGGNFTTDKYGYDIQADYKKRFGHDIQDSGTRDKLSSDIQKTLQQLEAKTGNTFDYQNFDPYRQPEAKKSMTLQQALGKGIGDLGEGVTSLTGSMVAGGLVVGAATTAIQLGTQAIKEMATTMYENNIKETALNSLAMGDTELVDDFVNKNITAVTKSDALSAAKQYAGMKLSSEQQGMGMNLAKDIAFASGKGSEFSTINDALVQSMQSGDISNLMSTIGIDGGYLDVGKIGTINAALELGKTTRDYSSAFKEINDYLSSDELYKEGLDNASKENQSKDWWGNFVRDTKNSFFMTASEYNASHSKNNETENKYNYDYTSSASSSSDSKTINNGKTPTWLLSDKSNDTIAKSAANSYMSNFNDSRTANITINLNSTGNTEEDAKMMGNVVNDSWNSEELTNVGTVNISGSR